MSQSIQARTPSSSGRAAARRRPAEAGELVVALLAKRAADVLLVLGQDVHAERARSARSSASDDEPCRRRTPPAAGRARPRRTSRPPCPTGLAVGGRGDHGDARSGSGRAPGGNWAESKAACALMGANGNPCPARRLDAGGQPATARADDQALRAAMTSARPLPAADAPARGRGCASTVSSSWVGSWWNSARRRAPDSCGDVHRVVDRAVAPGGLRRELLGGVLRVVDEQVDAVAQLEHRVGTRVAAVEGHAGGRRGRPPTRRPSRCGSRWSAPTWGTGAHLHLGAVELEVGVATRRGSGCRRAGPRCVTGKNGGRMNSSKAASSEPSSGCGGP